MASFVISQRVEKINDRSPSGSNDNQQNAKDPLKNASMRRKNKIKPRNEQLVQRLFGSIVIALLLYVISLAHLSNKGAFLLMKEYAYGDDPDSVSLQLPRPPDFQDLLKGDVSGGDPSQFRRIHLVISHCEESLNWLSAFISGYTYIINTTIISKCGSEIDILPENATIVRLPNVGRCDHSYAWWMSKHLSVLDDDDAVLFLKANYEIHQAAVPRNLTEMLDTASVTGFGCWLKLNRNGMSQYHDTKALSSFRKMSYQRKTRDGQLGFMSSYKDLGHWWKHVGVSQFQPVVPVCYGGNFVVNGSHIKEKGSALWSRIEQSLSRGDNIEEGHFAERTWAGLLSNPLSNENLTLIRMHTGIFLKMGMNGQPYGGVLADKQRLAMIDDLGELWKGDAEGGTHHPFRRLYLVISQCMGTLEWVSIFTKDYGVENTTVISKCNVTFNKPRHTYTTITMPNIGRHDHSYAWWITEFFDKIEDDDGVIFLKDNPHPEYDLAGGRKLTDVVRIAGENGFGCWLKLRFGMSAYHDTKFLMNYKATVPNESQRKKRRAMTFSSWARNVSVILPTPITPVCYDGIFVAKGSQIRKKGVTFWKNVLESFSTANDLRVASYLERSWAGLLSYMPSAKDLMKLQERSKIYYKMSRFGRPFQGVLVNKKLPDY